MYICGTLLWRRCENCWVRRKQRGFNKYHVRQVSLANSAIEHLDKITYIWNDHLLFQLFDDEKIVQPLPFSLYLLTPFHALYKTFHQISSIHSNNTTIPAFLGQSLNLSVQEQTFSNAVKSDFLYFLHLCILILVAYSL